MFVSENPLRLQMRVDSDSSGYLVKCVLIHFGVTLVKITSRKWLPRDCQRKAHYTPFLKHIFCSTILTWMVVLETNTAQLAIKFPVMLSSLWWEKPRTWALGPGRRRTTGKEADRCLWGKNSKALLLLNWSAQDTCSLMIGWKFFLNKRQPFTPEPHMQPRVYFYSKAKRLPLFVLQNPGQHSIWLWEKLGSFFFNRGWIMLQWIVPWADAGPPKSWPAPQGSRTPRRNSTKEQISPMQGPPGP